MDIACMRKFCDTEITDIMIFTDLCVFSPPEYKSYIWSAAYTYVLLASTWTIWRILFLFGITDCIRHKSVLCGYMNILAPKIRGI
jgi:hypothetical protein